MEGSPSGISQIVNEFIQLLEDDGTSANSPRDPRINKEAIGKFIKFLSNDDDHWKVFYEKLKDRSCKKFVNDVLENFLHNIEYKDCSEYQTYSVIFLLKYKLIEDGNEEQTEPPFIYGFDYLMKILMYSKSKKVVDIIICEISILFLQSKNKSLEEFYNKYLKNINNILAEDLDQAVNLLKLCDELIRSMEIGMHSPFERHFPDYSENLVKVRIYKYPFEYVERNVDKRLRILSLNKLIINLTKVDDKPFPLSINKNPLTPILTLEDLGITNKEEVYKIETESKIKYNYGEVYEPKLSILLEASKIHEIVFNKLISMDTDDKKAIIMFNFLRQMPTIEKNENSDWNSIYKKEGSIPIAQSLYSGILKTEDLYFDFSCKCKDTEKKAVVNHSNEDTKETKQFVNTKVTPSVHSINDKKVKVENHSQINNNGTSQLCGLQNMGATCYLNSVIQQLYHNEDFRCSLGKADKKNGVAIALGQLFDAMKNNSVNNNNYIINLINGFNDKEIQNMQGDAHEFFSKLLDKIEIKACRKLFFGNSEITRTNNDKEYRKVRNEPFSCISLNIADSKDFGDSLKKYLNSKIDNFNHNGEIISVDESIKITEFPDYLCIHLLRFNKREGNVTTTETTEKINKLFEFPLTFNTSSLMDCGNYDYDLKGVVAHCGSLNGGHYISFILNDDKIFLFNDSIARESTKEEFDEYTKEGNDKNEFSAYLLFYHKRESHK